MIERIKQQPIQEKPNFILETKKSNTPPSKELTNFCNENWNQKYEQDILYDNLEEKLKQCNVIWFTDNNKIIGASVFNTNESNGPMSLELVCIEENYQTRGIGEKLTEKSIEIMLQKQQSKDTLEINSLALTKNGLQLMQKIQNKYQNIKFNTDDRQLIKTELEKLFETIQNTKKNEIIVEIINDMIRPLKISSEDLTLEYIISLLKNKTINSKHFKSFGAIIFDKATLGTTNNYENEESMGKLFLSNEDCVTQFSAPNQETSTSITIAEKNTIFKNILLNIKEYTTENDQTVLDKKILEIKSDFEKYESKNNNTYVNPNNFFKYSKNEEIEILWIDDFFSWLKKTDLSISEMGKLELLFYTDCFSDLETYTIDKDQTVIIDNETMFAIQYKNENSPLTTNISKKKLIKN